MRLTDSTRCSTHTSKTIGMLCRLFVGWVKNITCSFSTCRGGKFWVATSWQECDFSSLPQKPLNALCDSGSDFLLIRRCCEFSSFRRIRYKSGLNEDSRNVCSNQNDKPGVLDATVDRTCCLDQCLVVRVLPIACYLRFCSSCMIPFSKYLQLLDAVAGVCIFSWLAISAEVLSVTSDAQNNKFQCLFALELSLPLA